MIRAALLAAALTLPLSVQAQDGADLLYSMMPAPLDGWTSAQSPDAEGMADMFGGLVAVQDYTGPGASFLLTYMADNNMANGMARQFDRPDQLEGLGEVTEIDGFLFLQQDDTVTGAVGALLIQSSGTFDATPVYDHLRTLDLSEIADMMQ